MPFCQKWRMQILAKYISRSVFFFLESINYAPYEFILRIFLKCDQTKPEFCILDGILFQ